MNIHEYQGKEIFKSYGVAVPNGKRAFSVDEAVEAARELKEGVYVVKAQIHAGGRGKAGGVKLAKSLDEVKAYAGELLGKTLVTHQTGPEGKVVKRLLIEEGCDIKKEYYVGLVIDRHTSRIVLMASTEGGMEIEEVAAKTPEKIIREEIDPLIGLADFQAKRVAFKLQMPSALVNQTAGLLQKLYKLFVEKDCSIVEINPLVVTGDGKVMALDAKINFDDNGLPRHPEIQALRDIDEEDRKEREAAEADLNYITLDGSVACMVNGAGLAMATTDVIQYFGGMPANFLDVGGGSDVPKIVRAFEIMASDAHVKSVFVNIFAGINKCDVIAGGLVEAMKRGILKVPVVVRLEGTNVELGRKILKESGIDVFVAQSMDEGAKKAVALAAGER